MPLVVGSFTLHGTEAENASIAAMAQKAADVLGTRVKNVQVSFLKGKDMPKRADGGPSVGYAPNSKRVNMWRAVNQYRVSDTFGHEVIHLLRLSKAQKEAICLLMTPAGATWNAPGYKDDGSETAARCGSRALFGIANPPYKSFYSHDIDPSKDAQLAAQLLGPVSVPEPEPPPQPTPADPVALQAEIDRLADLLKEVGAGNAELASANLTLANKTTQGAG